MFGWFKKRKASIDDREWVITTFRERRKAVEASGALEQVKFQIGLATYWSGFIGTHGSAVAFAQLPRNEQMEYFRKLLKLQAAISQKGDVEAAVPLQMMNLYLAAIINGDRVFEAEAAAFLDEHARQGHSMLPIRG
jgi:hypothetical protein